MLAKIATENDAKDITSLKAFLVKVGHPVVDGVTRTVDNQKITEGWKFEEVGDDEKQKLIGFIEQTGGEFTLDDVHGKLGWSETQLNQVVEVLQNEGVL